MIDSLLEPKPLPEWLLDIFPNHGDRLINDSRAVAAGSEGVVSEGQRNGTLTSLAGTMRRRGMSEAAIVGALIQQNIDKCDPPLPDDEVRDIAHSVARYTPVETSESRFHRTDLGNAKRLVALHGQDLRYSFPRKTWLVWAGIHWDPDNTGEVSRRAKDTVLAMYELASQLDDPDARAALAKHAAT